MPDKAALIVIFNHRYDKNIAALDALYRHRFSNIFYLIPFYDGDCPNAIPVYENSYQYQGYIAQGLRSYFKEDFTHYVFVADDLILHPEIDETNYAKVFGLDPDASFIPEPFEAHRLTNNKTLRCMPHQSGGETRFYWWRLMDLIKYRHRMEGLENGREMPTYDEAKVLLEEHGYTSHPLKFPDVYGPFPTEFGSTEDRSQALNYFKRLRHYRKEYKAEYPVVASFSDLAIVSKASIKKFAHYCGVLAANGMFVEFALPTALLLSSKKVVTEPILGRRGSVYWTYTKTEADNYAEAMAPFQKELSRLVTNFPADKLYLHPVKLSQWKV